MSVLTDTIDWFADSSNWSGNRGIPARVVEHLEYTGLTVAIASAIALPLGLWIGHTGRFRAVAVSITGAMRALPTLGLLTLLILYLGYGQTPAIASLVVLAIPPLLAGAYSGLESVDRRTIDSARAIGMTEWQVLFKVEIPLALPIIVGGIRSAVLQVIATATIAAYIGIGGLGTYIFDGLALRNYPQTVAGAVIVIVLALIADAIFAGIQKYASLSAAGRQWSPVTSSKGERIA